MALGDDVVVHRIGGAGIVNLRLKPGERLMAPPGISLLRAATPADAMSLMRLAYGKTKKWRSAGTVGTATVGAIRAAGFDVIADPSPVFPSHARLTHPAGAGAFTDENLTALAAVFSDTVA